jgi:hypothetical protein
MKSGILLLHASSAYAFMLAPKPTPAVLPNRSLRLRVTTTRCAMASLKF